MSNQKRSRGKKNAGAQESPRSAPPAGGRPKPVRRRLKGRPPKHPWLVPLMVFVAAALALLLALVAASNT